MATTSFTEISFWIREVLLVLQVLLMEIFRILLVLEGRPVTEQVLQRGSHLLTFHT